MNSKKQHYENLININQRSVTGKLCEKIIDYYNQNTSLTRDSEISQAGVDKKARKSTELDINWDIPLMHEIKEEIDSLIVDYLNHYPEVSRTFKSSYYETGHILKYDPNEGFYNYHYDRDGLSISDRVLSIIIYLNDVSEGGETEFKYFTPKTVKPEKRTVLIFPSEWTHTHRGNSPKSNEKFICVLWLRRGS